ncbi:MAG: alpha-galactosidase [Planctomycetes bacterium]|nr:alpha-galactosidase [Planctomycetota bacterium]
MPRIAVIGAGSMVFSRNLISDMLSFDAFGGGTFALMDIDSDRLAVAQAMGESINRTRGTDAVFEAHKERRAALDGADYVINTMGVGGFDATKRDLLIPAEYGLRQTIGDTLGIGGIFRTVRSLPVVLEMCREIEEACPGAYLLNYTNPMAMHCLGIQRSTRVKAVGLCHGVRYTRARMIFLAKLAGMSVEETAEVTADWTPEEDRGSRFWKLFAECLDDDEVRTVAAGINHMAAFLVFERNGRDIYPQLKRALERPDIMRIDPVRLELMGRFGYFMTETSGHIAEYLPWYLRDEAEIRRLDLRPLSYIATCRALDAVFRSYSENVRTGTEFIRKDEPLSIEYASRVLNALETGRPYVFNGNVHNRGGELISNLPGDCCVEVPCTADGQGIHPSAMGELPPQCAALMRTNVNVQDLTVRAITEHRKEHLYHAALLDPNTAATLTTSRIHELVDVMIKAHGELVPDYLR